MQQRIIHGMDEALEPIDSPLKRNLVRFQSRRHIEAGPIDQLLDFVQAEIQFPEEQDLLKPEHGGFVVIAIAILAMRRRLEQADLVVVMQGAGADTGQIG